MITLFKSLFINDFSFKRHVSNPKLIIEGDASFIKVSHFESHFIEHGSYILNGKTQTFYQKSIYKWDDQRLYIHKPDHSILHQFLLDESQLPIIFSHTHFCKDDHYEITFIIKSDDAFSIDYNIQGPQKKYQIHTDFQKNSYSFLKKI